MDGTALVDAEAPGPAAEVLAEALAEAGHGRDPARAARLRPIVILLGERGDEAGLAADLARRLAGSRGLVLMTGRETGADVATLVDLLLLAPDDALALVRAAAPALSAPAAAEVAALGDGIPGRLIALAHAARDWPGGDAPLPVPAALRAAAEAALAPLDAWPADLARWAALLREPFAVGALARTTLETPAPMRGAGRPDGGGVLRRCPDPPRRAGVPRPCAAGRRRGPGWGRAAPAPRRRAVAGRAAGDPPAEFALQAEGAADPAAVVQWRCAPRRPSTTRATWRTPWPTPTGRSRGGPRHGRVGPPGGPAPPRHGAARPLPRGSRRPRRSSRPPAGAGNCRSATRPSPASRPRPARAGSSASTSSRCGRSRTT